MAKAKYSKNPSVHIDDYGNPHLNILLHFFIEKDLPKYKNFEISESKGDSDESKDMHSIVTGPFAEMEARASLSHRSRITDSDWGYHNALVSEIRNNQKETNKILVKLFSWIERIFGKKVPAEEIFKKAKESFKLPVTEDLEKARDSVNKLLKLLIDSGQVKQATKLHDYSEILSGEIVLLKNGISKYLLEEDVIDFMLKSEKGVFIDFLRNFSNILPLDVAKKKLEIDKLLIFDNYAVMYYDPSIDPFRKLKEEDVRRKAADPILFGLIAGSNKLYYITDWIYQDDDITMEKVEKLIGRKAKQIKQGEDDQELNKFHILIDDLENIVVNNTINNNIPNQ